MERNVFLTPSQQQRAIAREIMRENRTKKPWSVEEIEVLKKYYGKIRSEEVARMLPGRSTMSVRMKAIRLGLKSNLNLRKPWYSLRKLNLSSEELAYIAGFIDGEGEVSFFPVKKGGRRYWHPLIKISNTNAEVIEWLRTSIGGRISCTRKNERCKPCWTLTISGYTGTYYLLKKLLPYLIVKRRQAEILLYYADLAKGGEARSSEKMLKLVEEARSLNAKGVKKN
jgi:hypothetical protein